MILANQFRMFQLTVTALLMILRKVSGLWTVLECSLNGGQCVLGKIDGAKMFVQAVRSGNVLLL